MTRKRTQLFIAGMAALTLSVFVMLVTGALRELVVVPLAYSFYLLSRLIAVIPQNVLWGVLIAVVALVALRSLNLNLLDFITPEPDTSPEPGEGRVSVIARWFSGAASGMYFRQRIKRHLLDLLLEARGYDPTMPDRQVQTVLSRLDLPEDVREYLRGGLRRELTEVGGLRQRLLRRMQPESAVYTDPALDRTIEYLEGELHADH